MSKTLAPWLDESVAPNGRSVKENFCNWFEGSQVVDSSGFPLKVFHGSNHDFNVFKPSETGTFGSGIYFADSSASANEYGCERLIEAFVNLRNPWIVRADYDSESVEIEEFDCPLISSVLALKDGRALLENAKQAETGHFDQALQDELLRMGHDGILATYTDGCMEVIAFHPHQIKSATHNNGLYQIGSLDITDQSVTAAQNAHRYLEGLERKTATPYV